MRGRRRSASIAGTAPVTTTLNHKYSSVITTFLPIRAAATVLLALSVAAVSPATAQQKMPAAARPPVQRLGGSGAWNAFLYKEKSGRVCYLAGGPQKSAPAKLRRKTPSAMITHRPQENALNVVSFDAGIPLQEGSDAALEVDSAHFDLFTKGDTAWSRTSDLDRTIVEAMAKGRQAVFKATPRKGPPLTDTYSLAGFAQALALIDKACTVKR
jgi:invasion protein IalB